MLTLKASSLLNTQYISIKRFFIKDLVRKNGPYFL